MYRNCGYCGGGGLTSKQLGNHSAYLNLSLVRCAFNAVILAYMCSEHATFAFISFSHLFGDFQLKKKVDVLQNIQMATDVIEYKSENKHNSAMHFEYAFCSILIGHLLLS